MYAVKMEGGLPRQDERAERAKRTRSDQAMYIGKKGCISCEKSSNCEETCLSRKDRKHTPGPSGYAFSLHLEPFGVSASNLVVALEHELVHVQRRPGASSVDRAEL